MKSNDINKILKRPFYKACSQYGAQMGRRSQCQGEQEPLHLQPLKMIDGDYDTGGAYWGGYPSDPMWCAFSPNDSVNDDPIMIFTRARSRDEAAEKAQEELAVNGYDTPWSFVK